MAALVETLAAASLDHGEDPASLGNGEDRHLPALHADAVRLVALSCSFVSGLRWCATCRDFHAARPPLLTLVVGNGIAGLWAPVSAFICPGPLRDPDHEFGDYGRWLNQQSLRVPRITDVISEAEASAQELIEYQRASGGFVLFWSLRPCGQRRPCCKQSMHFLDRMPSAFAAELTRLSVSVTGHAEEDLCSCSQDQITHQGGWLTSLRVLEVLILSDTNVHATGPRAAVEATVQMIRSAAPTLRSLALLSGSNLFTLRDVRSILEEAGKHLHYLSVCLPGTCVLDDYCDGRGVLIQPLSAAASNEPWVRFVDERLFFPRGTEVIDEEGSMYVEWPDPDGEPSLHAELNFDEDEEMQTDMLSNMAHGLCIRLLEPARVIAHAPGWGEAARRQCEAALPRPHWLL